MSDVLTADIYAAHKVHRQDQANMVKCCVTRQMCIGNHGIVPDAAYASGIMPATYAFAVPVRFLGSSVSGAQLLLIFCKRCLGLLQLFRNVVQLLRGH